MIDTGFDVYTDTPPGKDPDSHSATLRRYHARLWSKPLPGGGALSLQVASPQGYLRHRFENGMDMGLSSDSIGHSYRYTKSMAVVIDQIPAADIDAFFALCSTVGAYMLFPSGKVDGKITINGARGMHPRIKDRFDLTLECIRLHYAGQASPLGPTLARYSEFFGLFLTFAGFIEFFLLQDIVDDRAKTIRFVLPFAGFESAASPLPTSVAAYLDYRDAMTSFIHARNARMANWDNMA